MGYNSNTIIVQAERFIFEKAKMRVTFMSKFARDAQLLYEREEQAHMHENSSSS